jgi:hypothetical protein
VDGKPASPQTEFGPFPRNQLVAMATIKTSVPFLYVDDCLGDYVSISIYPCRLGRLLTELLPEPEVIGLLSLVFASEIPSARTSPTGKPILLDNQDRALWNRVQIAEGVGLVERALKSHRFGSYALQAAFAAALWSLSNCPSVFHTEADL